MNEIGELFRVTREEAGVSITEASKDLDIKEDIFVLKDYIYNYSKYLGIDSDKIIDDFNEYMFEYTSRIPLEDIEKKIEEQKIEKNDIISPYTKVPKKHNKSFYVFIYSTIVLIVIALVIWSIRQITISRETATIISYIK